MTAYSSATRSKPRVSVRRRKEILLGILFASPVMLGFLIFVFLPIVVSFIMSLTNYAIVNQASFVGFENYRRLFLGQDQFFYKSLNVTFYYVLLSVPLQIIVALFLAVMLNANIRARSLFRTIFYLPTIVPVVASSLIWLWLFDPDMGIFNTALRALNLPTSMWIWSEQTVIPSLAMMSVWSVGATMVIFLAGLQGIPRQLYEAVDVDGGKGIHKFMHITLPMLSPTIFFNVVMAIINSFQVFNQAFIMTEGGPNNASMVYVYYLYREAFKFQEMGRACAIGWVMFIIIMIATILVFRSSSLWVYYEGEVK